MSKFHSGDSLDQTVAGASDSDVDEEESDDQNSENDADDDGGGHTAIYSDSDQEVSMFADHVLIS